MLAILSRLQFVTYMYSWTHEVGCWLMYDGQGVRVLELEWYRFMKWPGANSTPVAPFTNID